MVGEFRVVRKLGEGGMGAVFLAVHKALGQHVVLKGLHPHLTRDPLLQSRLAREAEAMARLRHPNIVSIYNFIAVPEGAFIVMEYVEGVTFDDLIIKFGSLPPDQAVQLMLPVTRALEFAHKQGVIHRDLKPVNMMLGFDERVRVLDFGTAKIVDQPGITRSGTTLGTATYMSPEQLMGMDLAPAADVYSLGATLYEILTGQLPYEAQSTQELVKCIFTESPTPPSVHAPGIPLKLEEVVLRSLAKKAEQRYASAKEMADALETVLKSLPASQPLFLGEPGSAEAQAAAGTVVAIRAIDEEGERVAPGRAGAAAAGAQPGAAGPGAGGSTTAAPAGATGAGAAVAAGAVPRPDSAPAAPAAAVPSGAAPTTGAAPMTGAAPSAAAPAEAAASGATAAAAAAARAAETAGKTSPTAHLPGVVGALAAAGMGGAGVIGGAVTGTFGLAQAGIVVTAAGALIWGLGTVLLARKAVQLVGEVTRVAALAAQAASEAARSAVEAGAAKAAADAARAEVAAARSAAQAGTETSRRYAAARYGPGGASSGEMQVGTGSGVFSRIGSGVHSPKRVAARATEWRYKELDSSAMAAAGTVSAMTAIRPPSGTHAVAAGIGAAAPAPPPTPPGTRTSGDRPAPGAGW
jgi:serine/threonine-protein kinase